MDNAYTISAHFGKKMSRDHNIRNRNITNSEDHIDPDGYFKIIEDRPIKQAYYKIFGQAVLDYNAKQTRSDRQIIDYHTKVLSAYKRDPNRNPATSHEAIIPQSQNQKRFSQIFQTNSKKIILMPSCSVPIPMQMSLVLPLIFMLISYQ